MALLINKQMTVKGFNLSELYIRLRIINNLNGNKLEVTTSTYASKSVFKENPNSNELNFNIIPKIINIDYNRTVDGVDILSVTHNKIKEYLSTDVTTDITDINPDTGEEETKTVITRPKYFNESEISIIDID